jgi:hypothetical protein
MTGPTLQHFRRIPDVWVERDIMRRRSWRRLATVFALALGLSAAASVPAVAQPASGAHQLSPAYSDWWV